MTIFEQMIHEMLTEDVIDYVDGWIEDNHKLVIDQWVDVMISQGESYGYLKMVNDMPGQAYFIVCQAEGRPA